MPFDQQYCRGVSQKLSRRLPAITGHSGPEAVHKLRTSTRRVETVVEELVQEPDRSTRKLLKMLRRLRKKAGRVRDLDAQIALLRSLKIAPGGGQKSQLLRNLTGDRGKREKKLSGELGKNTVRELRKRLARACRNLEAPEGLDSKTLAFQTLSELARNHSPLTQKTVHEHRIAVKRARYIMEMAGKDAEAKSMIENLRKVQDIIGDWHDWLTLTERAEDLFGGVKESALVAALRNLTRAKFRESVNAIVHMRSTFSDGENSRIKNGSLNAAGEITRRQPAKSPHIISTAA